jgi:A/G-specific adenine glycosylase
MNETPQRTVKSYFTKQLMAWNRTKNKRAMPWKGEKDPYKIWLSEIILQQTRVEQGWAYYNNFVKHHPTVYSLASAPENEVFKLWEGLGYYSRCKNLIATAKKIVNNYNGTFPNNYNDILQLKGVGPYTAAAIASFAFNLPYAVVDGNVFRVLARYFGNKTAIDSTIGKKLFTELANTVLHKKQPGAYNQAIMDFGATLCKPQQPLCTTCPLKTYCKAYSKNIVNSLPVKEKKLTVKTRWFCYIIATNKNEILVRKRAGGDIWENLYEFVLYESPSEITVAQLQHLSIAQHIAGNNKQAVFSTTLPYKQKLTHQTIFARFVQINILKKMAPKGYHWVPTSQLKHLPFPKIITQYLKDKNVSLNLM